MKTLDSRAFHTKAFLDGFKGAFGLPCVYFTELLRVLLLILASTYMLHICVAFHNLINVFMKKKPKKRWTSAKQNIKIQRKTYMTWKNKKIQTRKKGF